MTNSSETVQVWLAKKYFDELSLQIRSTWDLYLKFYVMFLTLNGTALGLTVQYVADGTARAVIAVAFILHNVLAGATAIVIAKWSRSTATRAQNLVEYIAARSEPQAQTTELPEVLAQSPLPGTLGLWSGVANALGHIVFIALWILVICLGIGPPSAPVKTVGVAISWALSAVC